MFHHGGERSKARHAEKEGIGARVRRRQCSSDFVSREWDKLPNPKFDIRDRSVGIGNRGV